MSKPSLVIVLTEDDHHEMLIRSIFVSVVWRYIKLGSRVPHREEEVPGSEKDFARKSVRIESANSKQLLP
jgi:hypothetical protein